MKPGEGAFYGPKIDVDIDDALGRSWQLATIQLDFNLPERFELEYIGEDGQPHRPVMIHRAIYGTYERFLGILVEHYAGAFPLWLAPVQVDADPGGRPPPALRGGRRREAARGRPPGGGRRSRRAHEGYKIRDAQLQKIPYMLVVGNKEAEAGTVAVRERSGEDRGALPVEEFLTEALERVRTHQ